MLAAVFLRQFRPIKSILESIKIEDVIKETFAPSNVPFLPLRTSCLVPLIALWGACLAWCLCTILPTTPDISVALLLTRHDGVCDVEVVEGEAQGLPWGGGGGAGGLGRGSGRLDRGSLGSRVPAGLQPVVLCLEQLNLVLGDWSVRKEGEEWEEHCQCIDDSRLNVQRSHWFCWETRLTWCLTNCRDKSLCLNDSTVEKCTTL